MDKDYEGEELDPPNLYLPGDQDKLIQAVAAANKNTIVVLNNGSPILMDKWFGQVPGLVEAWYAGQETGTAVADILFGDVNPSGKLPDTLAVRREDYSDWGNYPGNGTVVNYAEGIYVGYRHFDKHKIAPLFPFGFGLSYTTFGYSGLVKRRTSVGAARRRLCAVTVQNTGKRAGDEVAQLYVRPLALPSRPARPRVEGLRARFAPARPEGRRHVPAGRPRVFLLGRQDGTAGRSAPALMPSKSALRPATSAFRAVLRKL